MKAQHTAGIYNKPFRLQSRDGTVGIIDIEVYRDADSGEEILTAASLAAITKAKIVALRGSHSDLLEACQQMLRYIERKEAHQGCMDADQLEAAEKRVRETVSSVSTGRWIGDQIHCDLRAARAAITKATAQAGGE